MRILKQYDSQTTFPYIAYIPEIFSDRPAIHGAGERGNGGKNLDRVLIHGFNDDNLRDCVLIMPQCPVGTFWAAKVEILKWLLSQKKEG